MKKIIIMFLGLFLLAGCSQTGTTNHTSKEQIVGVLVTKTKLSSSFIEKESPSVGGITSKVNQYWSVYYNCRSEDPKSGVSYNGSWDTSSITSTTVEKDHFKITYYGNISSLEDESTYQPKYYFYNILSTEEGKYKLDYYAEIQRNIEYSYSVPVQSTIKVNDATIDLDYQLYISNLTYYNITENPIVLDSDIIVIDGEE